MDQNPFNALPPVVVALAAVIAGIEVLFQLADAGLLGGAAGVGWRQGALQDYAVFDQVWHFMIDNRLAPPEQLARFVTYPLIQSGALPAVFALVFVLAIGKAVGEVFAPWAVLALFFGSALGGGLAFVVLLDAPGQLNGAFPPVYGLIGGFTFLLWTNLAAHGANANRAFILIAVLLGVQLLFALLNGDWRGVVSEAAGFATGFALSFVLSPGGWARVVAKLRRR